MGEKTVVRGLSRRRLNINQTLLRASGVDDTDISITAAAASPERCTFSTTITILRAIRLNVTPRLFRQRRDFSPKTFLEQHSHPTIRYHSIEASRQAPASEVGLRSPFNLIGIDSDSETLVRSIHVNNRITKTQISRRNAKYAQTHSFSL